MVLLFCFARKICPLSNEWQKNYSSSFKINHIGEAKVGVTVKEPHCYSLGGGQIVLAKQKNNTMIMCLIKN